MRYSKFIVTITTILCIALPSFAQPTIAVDLNELEFGEVLVNDIALLTLTITNRGNENLTISDVTVDSDRFMTDFQEDIVIEPDANQVLTVVFSPDNRSDFDQTLTIFSNDPDNDEHTVSLTGSGYGWIINEVGTFETPGAAQSVSVAGDVAYVADYDDGFTIINVTDPSNPELYANYELEERARDIFIVGNYAYVASGLTVFNITDPADPQITGALNTGASAYSIYVAGGVSYVGDSDGNLYLFDVSDPDTPVEDPLGTFDAGARIGGIFVVGDLAYLAIDRSGLLIINISDPADIQEVGEFNTDDRSYSVFVEGDYAYVADGLTGLIVFDISDPTNPNLLGVHNTPGSALKVTVVGDYAYIADSRNGIQVVDISDPEDPFGVGAYHTPGEAKGIFVSDNLIYVADHSNGIHILDYQLPPPEPTWQIDITATVGDYIDADNYAGGAEDGSFDYDAGLDLPEAPHMPQNFISLFFPHPEWDLVVGDNFLSDIVPEEAHVDEATEWYFEVETDQEDQDITLAFTPDDMPNMAVPLLLEDLETEEVIILWNVNTYEYNSGDGSARGFNLIYGNKNPPLPTLIQPNGGELFSVGNQFEITWEVDLQSDVPMATSTILVSLNGGEAWEQIGQTEGENYSFDWEIPDAYTPNCLVKVVTADELGYSAEDVSDDLFGITHGSSEHNFLAGWSLFSLPLIPNNGRISEVLGDDYEEFSYFVYDYNQTDGAVWLDYSIEISNGNCYWLGTMNDAVVDVDGQAPMEAVTVNLVPGWNLIGDPFPQVTPTESVEIINGEETYTLAEAVDAGLVQDVFYSYQLVNDRYRFVESDNLEPWLGYCFPVISDANLQMRIPIVDPIEEPERDDKDESDEGTLSNWHLTIQAEIEGAVDRITTFGVAETATDSFDAAYDYPEPPNPPNGTYVSGYFEHRWDLPIGNKFNRDFRGAVGRFDEGRLEWNLTVVTNDSVDVTLSWPDRDETMVRAELCTLLVMENLTNNEFIMLYEQESYTYCSDGRDRFRIRFRTTDVDNDDTDQLPSQLYLSQAYPNPFNATTKLSYGLPLTTNVSIQVFNLTGQLIATLVNGDQSAGFHTIIWDAVDVPSGIYFVKMEAGDFVITRKLTLMK